MGRVREFFQCRMKSGYLILLHLTDLTRKADMDFVQVRFLSIPLYLPYLGISSSHGQLKVVCQQRSIFCCRDDE